MADTDETRKYPSGYRFDPFDHELINDYLKPEVLGKQLPCNIVLKNIEVYGPSSNPWQVFDPNHHSWLISPRIKPSQKYMFVFAKLSKLSKSDTSKNTSRKAGCGTWVGKTSRKKIRDDKGSTSEAPVIVGGDVCENLDERRTLTSKNLTAIDSGVGDGGVGVGDSFQELLDFAGDFCSDLGGENLDESRTLTSKNLTALDSGVGDSFQELLDFGGDFCSDLGGENLDERRTLTSKNLTALDSGVGDSGVGDSFQELLDFGGDFCSDLGGVGDSFQELLDFAEDFFSDLGGENFYLDDLGGFETDCTDWITADSITAILDSNQEDELVGNNSFSKSGKRKSEAGENSCRTKKMCL